MRVAAFALVLVLSGCESEKGISGYDALEQHVASARVGSDADHWIEMKNMMGEWERTGLIFGYNGDFGECQKAIAGLRQSNDQREYRCIPAN